LFDAHKRETRRAAMSYLVMMHVGFVFLLVGFVTLQARGLSVSFEALGAYFSLYAPLPLFLLFLVGFGMKAGLFPLHSWLPEAHPAAPAHISAFMSGVMIKMGIYGILRVVSFMQTDLLWAGVILLVLGIVTAVWGVLFAAVQNDMKRMLAWSSIENVGVIFIAVGVALIGRATHSTMLTLCAMGGALLHTFNHSMFKTLLFFGTGNVYTATHTTSLDELGGVAKKMPVTAALFLVGVLAICALPPLSGFVSEFLIYYGLMDTVAAGGGGIMISLAGLLALSFTGGVAIVAFTKLYGMVFLGVPRSGAVASAREVDVVRVVASAIPLAGILLVGLAPMLVMRTVFTAAGSVSATGGAEHLHNFVDRDIWMIACTGGIFIGATLLIYLLKMWALRGRTVTASPTWGCGYGAPSARMQYTGESYSEGLQSIAPQLSGTADPGSAVGPNEIFPQQRRFSVKRSDTVASAFNTWWVELLRQINRRVMAMRTGKVNYYILYALLFLLLILILSIFSVI
ncbi:MAG: NADH-quinone oxidoreductase subunit E, partial [Rikenellaceae bacterium]|nr:NADH-quinone oxidoreductase subunit E [Rikenellaceae bacterium]